MRSPHAHVYLRRFLCGFARARSDGEFQLELPMRPEVLEVVLHFYDRGVIQCPPDIDVAEVVDACDYMLIPPSTKTIAYRNMGV